MLTGWSQVFEEWRGGVEVDTGTLAGKFLSNHWGDGHAVSIAPEHLLKKCMY